MSLVQAHKRVKKYVHTFPGFEPLVFEPNAIGDVVADVQSPDLVERLLQTPTGFRIYGTLEAAEISTLLTDLPRPVVQDPVQVDESLKYVLKDEATGTEFDLRPLDDAALHEFAKANGITVHHKAKGDTIRDKIIQAFQE